MRMRKLIVYIAGPITGVEDYHDAFEQAEDDLILCGCATINPANLPEGMTPDQYMRICTAMVDGADAVCMLPGWRKSKGATIEERYARYLGKPVMHWPGLPEPEKSRFGRLCGQVRQVEAQLGLGGTES